MPYIIRKTGSQFCVFKKAQDGGVGEKRGCSDSMDEARSHLRALYANENKELSDEELNMLVDAAEEDYMKEYGDMAEMPYPAYVYGATSYADLEQMEQARMVELETTELVNQFPLLARNILGNPDIADKHAALIELADELAYRLQVEIEDVSGDEEKEKRSDVSDADRARAVEEYGEVQYADPQNKKYPIDTPAHIRAAWSYINMPRNARKYSPAQVRSIKSRIVSAWKRKIGKDGPPAAKKSIRDIVIDAVKEVLGQKEEARPDTGIMLWKDASGKWLWAGRYSNNLRDRDNPPEIIAAESHRRFVERVEKGLAPYPELWLWHIKEWCIGKADWVGFDDSGFAIAAGHFLPGCEQVAEWLSDAKEMRMSHGMPPSTIRRADDDPTIIIEHETREISVLPDWAAANELTGFYVLRKEQPMAIPSEKKAVLIEQWNMPPELIETIEQLNAADAKEAAENGIESKEVADQDAVPVEEVTEDAAPAEETPAETPAPEETPAAPVPTSLTREEVAEAMVSFFGPVIDQLAATVKEIESLKAELQAVREGQDASAVAVKEALENMPTASLATIIAGRMRAVGSPDAAVDGRSSLGRSKPAETKETGKQGPVGIPFIDQMLSNSRQ